MLWNDNCDFFFAHQLIIIIVAINVFPDFAPIAWFLHWKYDKIMLFSPPPAHFHGVRRTVFSPFTLAAHHWHLLLFSLCSHKLLYFKIL